jgi:hypothetical protein
MRARPEYKREATTGSKQQDDRSNAQEVQTRPQEASQK